MADQISHITPEQIAQYGVVAAPDVLRGPPGDNKAIFDRLVRELVAVAVNQIIDETNVLLLSEDVRQAQEEARQAGENGRVSTEETRAAAEDTRGNQEEARETAEQGRVSAEKARVQAETARAAAEGSREGAESARVSAETVRETSAQQMKSALETAEQARETAEQGRVSAEAARSVWEPYDPGKNYVPGNKASSGGSSYLCKAPVRGTAPPDPAYWVLIAAKGLDGTGAGDMLAAVYDPAGKERDVFAYADAAEAAAKTASRPSTWTPTPAEIGAAPSAHTHEADDIATGIFPVERGGTGAADAAGARANLGAVGAAELAAYDKTVKAIYPVASGQSITAGDVVDIVNGELTKYEVALQLGTLPVGTVIQLNEFGIPVDYIIVHQGKPSSLYDDSCNGTWVLRKDVTATMQWHNSDVNDYVASDIKRYLVSDFPSRFDSWVQQAIKQVKIPYRPGSGTSTTVYSGANGLPCKVFLLSALEVGYTSSTVSPYIVNDGTRLDYFPLGNANAKKIAYLNGVASSWWLRSPYTGDARQVWLVSGDDGGGFNYYCTSLQGLRPAFILPPTLVSVTDEPTQAISLTTATDGQPCEVIYSGVASLPGITEGEVISSDGVYGVGVLDGVLQVWSKDRPGRVVTGSYLGNGSSSRFINIGFTPKAVMLTANGLLYSTGSISNGIAFYNAPLKNKAVSGQPTALKITQSGFTAYNSSSDNIFLNSSGDQYNYIAIP